MSTAVLLSIKPEFALAIFAGKKKFEFRKAVYRNPEVETIYVYASAPLSKVIGTFSVDEVIEHHPEDLWKKTSSGAGISREYFDQYFEGRERGYALKVRETELFKEFVSLIDMFGLRHPPQSFRYVSEHEVQ